MGRGAAVDGKQARSTLRSIAAGPSAFDIDLDKLRSSALDGEFLDPNYVSLEVRIPLAGGGRVTALCDPTPWGDAVWADPPIHNCPDVETCEHDGAHRTLIELLETIHAEAFATKRGQWRALTETAARVRITNGALWWTVLRFARAVGVVFDGDEACVFSGDRCRMHETGERACPWRMFLRADAVLDRVPFVDDAQRIRRELGRSRGRRAPSLALIDDDARLLRLVARAAGGNTRLEIGHTGKRSTLLYDGDCRLCPPPVSSACPHADIAALASALV